MSVEGEGVVNINTHSDDRLRVCTRPKGVRVAVKRSAHGACLWAHTYNARFNQQFAVRCTTHAVHV